MPIDVNRGSKPLTPKAAKQVTSDVPKGKKTFPVSSNVLDLKNKNIELTIPNKKQLPAQSASLKASLQADTDALQSVSTGIEIARAPATQENRQDYFGPNPAADPAFLSTARQVMDIGDPQELLALIEKNFGKQAGAAVYSAFDLPIKTAVDNNYLSPQERQQIVDFLKKYPILSQQSPVAPVADPAFLSIARQVLDIRDPHDLLALIEKNFGKQAGAAVYSAFDLPIKTAVDNNYLSPQERQQIVDFLKKYTDFQEAKKPQAARKIQGAFRQHLKKIEQVNPNYMGYAQLVYDGNQAAEKGKEYYLNMDLERKGFTRGPVVYRPARIPNNAPQGKFKKVDRADQVDRNDGSPGRFISLVPVNKMGHFEQESEINNNDLRGLKTLIHNTVVTDTLIIARQVIPVSTYKAGKIKIFKVMLKDLQRTVYDLKKLHQRGSFVIDIKLENTGYNKKEGLIYLYDIGQRVSQSSGYDDVIYFSNSSTNGLLNIFSSGSLQTKINAFRAWDNYAFLLLAIQLTTGNPQLVSKARQPVGVDILGGKYPGAMNPPNSRYYME